MKNRNRILHQTLIAFESCILAMLMASFVVDKLPGECRFVCDSACEFTVGVDNANVLKDVISYGQVYFRTNECFTSKARYAVSFRGTTLSNGLIHVVSPYPVSGFTFYLNFKPGTYDPAMIKLTDPRLNGQPIDLVDTRDGNSKVGYVSYAYLPQSSFNGYPKETLGVISLTGLCAFLLSGFLMRKEVV